MEMCCTQINNCPKILPWKCPYSSFLYKQFRTPVKIWNVVLEKDGDEVDRLCEIGRSITKSQRGEEYPTNNNKNEG